MNLYTSVFAYVCSIGLYNGIVNADTQNARIVNADGQETPRNLRVGTESPAKGEIIKRSPLGLRIKHKIRIALKGATQKRDCLT